MSVVTGSAALRAVAPILPCWPQPCTAGASVALVPVRQLRAWRQNGLVKKLVSYLLLGLVLTGVLLGAGLFVVQRWMGTDDFKARVELQIGAALGLAVKLGQVQVDVWPVPAVALVDVVIQTGPVVAARRVEARPVLRSLLAGRMELATLLLRHADLPQAGIDELLASVKKNKQPRAPGGQSAQDKVEPWAVIPHRLVLDAVTWRSTSGEVITVDGDIQLGAEGLPDALKLRILAGKFQGAQIELARKALVWDVKISHAHGTIKGQLELENMPAANLEMAFKGQLDTQDLEVGEFIHKARGVSASPLSGRLEASTNFSGRASNIGAVMDGLQTHSKFTVRNAVVHGIDLARAVRTVGLNRGGETRLDTLAGQLSTKGKAVQLNNLVASSGALSASGNITLTSSSALGGRINVSLGAPAIGNVVGVPLLVGGSLDAPEVTLTRAAMLGAAIGTVVMPGVGTGAGAALGDKVGSAFKGLFGK